MFANFLYTVSKAPDYDATLPDDSPLGCLAQLKVSLLVEVELNKVCSNSAASSTFILPFFNYSLDGSAMTLSPSVQSSDGCSLCGSLLPHTKLLLRERPAVIIAVLPANHISGVNRIPAAEERWMPENHSSVRLPAAGGYRLVAYCEISRHPTSDLPLSCVAGFKVSESHPWLTTTGSTFVEPSEPEVVIYVLDRRIVDPSRASELPNIRGPIVESQLLSSMTSSSLSSSSTSLWEPVVVQVRKRDSDDLFEFDLMEPSFELLKGLIAGEMVMDPSLIKKISRADNVIVRNDAHVKRLKGICQLVIDI